MKLGHIICLNDSLVEFENGFSLLKNMAAREQQLGQNICSYDSSAECGNGTGPLKNTATRGRGSFPYIATVKPC